MHSRGRRVRHAHLERLCQCFLQLMRLQTSRLWAPCQMGCDEIACDLQLTSVDTRPGTATDAPISMLSGKKWKTDQKMRDRLEVSTAKFAHVYETPTAFPLSMTL